VRGMALTPETPYEEFVDRVTAKFGKLRLGLKFKDEDGGKVTLRDDSDYELAIETAREHASLEGQARGQVGDLVYGRMITQVINCTTMVRG